VIYKKQLAKSGGSDRMAGHLKKAHAKMKSRGHGMHAADHASVRTAEYKGHTIEIKSHYEILINGKKLEGHMAVGNDGRVHYHPIPNYSSASMVDLTKDIIDSFPDDFPKPVKKKIKKKTAAKKAMAKPGKKMKKSKHRGH